MARTPKPLQLHVIDGTRPHGAHGVEYTPLAELPPPPPTVGVHGRELWERFGRATHAAGLLQELDVFALEVLAVMWDRFQTAARSGDELNAASLQAMRTMFSEFGATPAARRKVGPSLESGKRTNPFSKFKRPAAAS